MLIYNTLTRKKEEFHPINVDFVTMYVCGPTVYDYFHIGNARSFIMADIIRRYLEFRGFKVKFAMNITDVDDNIIKKSIQEKKPASEVASFYAQAFFDDLKKLKVNTATFNPKATNHIDTMIALISDLEEKGIAYNVNGNVFYNVSKFGEYGKLSGKNIDELEAGARIEINDEKRNPLDFALWKKAKEGEPSWDSPWGKGRPGWHIECSAMSTQLLGKTIDIHAGGNDLIFPHHENEIAQSESAYEQKFVNYWMHFGFLNIQNEKMSKSLGNFFTAREILTKYSAETIRLFFSQTYYGGPLNFSSELLDSAQKGVEKIINLSEKIEQSLKTANAEGTIPEFNFQKYYNDFTKVMDDDFNTPQGVAVIFDFVKSVNKIISENGKIGLQLFINAKKFLIETADNVLGIVSFNDLGKTSEGLLEEDLIKLLIHVRETLKKEKNFSLADQIRNELNKLGVILEDSKSGTTFKKR